ncbi:MAG: hypothetical protein JSS64_12520 [Bacteroidetes bacterium]|nr:hypothetical protein [Bacteroidota bacterium]
MRTIRYSSACALLLILSIYSVAKTTIYTVSNFIVQTTVPRRLTVGNGLDLSMLSTSVNTKADGTQHLTTPRFTAVVNLGISLHYDLSKNIGLISGIGLRNMGFVEEENGYTVKRRVYSLGIPLGIKIGDLRNRNFLFLGGGADFPFHYREKRFTKRNEKSSYSKWMGDETPRVLPFIFAGYSFDPGITLKVQYYPGNFLNDQFMDSHNNFSGQNVHLLLLSIGLDIRYNQYKIQERQYQELKQSTSNKVL